MLNREKYFLYRDKFQKIEEETAEGSRKARQTLEQLKQKVSKTVEDAQHNEMLQKASELLPAYASSILYLY